MDSSAPPSSREQVSIFISTGLGTMQLPIAGTRCLIYINIYIYIGAGFGTGTGVGTLEQERAPKLK